MSTVLMVNVAESYRLCWTAITPPCWVALFILKWSDLFVSLTTITCMLQFIFFVHFLSFYFKSTFVFLISSRATVVAVAAFLDAFQKVADLATNSRGRKFQCVAGSSILHQTYCSSLTRQTALLTGLKLLSHCLTVYVSYYSCITVFV